MIQPMAESANFAASMNRSLLLQILSTNSSFSHSSKFWCLLISLSSDRARAFAARTNPVAACMHTTYACKAPLTKQQLLLLPLLLLLLLLLQGGCKTYRDMGPDEALGETESC